jgi:hypothetical protein
MSRAIVAEKRTRKSHTVKARGRKTMTAPKQKVDFYPSAGRISRFSNTVEGIETNGIIRFNKVK